MNKKIRWITETAVMLALLVTLQYLTKPLGQLVTGSFVNAILAVSVLLAGLGSGITVALISPVLAYLLGIAPQVLTVPVIMVGNLLYVLMLHLLSGSSIRKRITAWVIAANVKFFALYTMVSYLICDLLAPMLLEKGLLKAPMLTALPATFGAAQLVTALIGGGVAMLIVPVLRKALHK